MLHTMHSHLQTRLQSCAPYWALEIEQKLWLVQKAAVRFLQGINCMGQWEGLAMWGQGLLAGMETCRFQRDRGNKEEIHVEGRDPGRPAQLDR